MQTNTVAVTSIDIIRIVTLFTNNPTTASEAGIQVRDEAIAVVSSTTAMTDGQGREAAAIVYIHRHCSSCTLKRYDNPIIC